MATLLAEIFTCDDCHQEAGTKRFGLPDVGVFADCPQHRARDG